MTDEPTQQTTDENGPEPADGGADRLDPATTPVPEGELPDDALAGIDGGYMGPPPKNQPSPFERG